MRTSRVLDNQRSIISLFDIRKLHLPNSTFLFPYTPSWRNIFIVLGRCLNVIRYPALSRNRCLNIASSLFGATVNIAYSVNIPLIKPTINIAIPGKLRRRASLRRAREVNVGAALGGNSDFGSLHQSRRRGTGWLYK